MSLSKQLWIALVLVMLVTLGGTFMISTISARDYLEQQLYLKNLDNAGSLALSLSQMDKDSATLDLLVSVQFDSGHYQSIRLTDPSGAVLVERVNPPVTLDVPDWFFRLVPIQVEPGSASVQEGWTPFGTLTVESHSRFAYEALWQESRRLLIWFLSSLVAGGLVGTLVLRWITRPLAEVVRQAEAIGMRKFIQVDEPKTCEFRTVVRAMNRLSGRVKGMLEEEAARFEKLRIEAHYDEVSGLLTRSQFINEVASVLAHDDASAAGALVIARLGELAQLNRTQGRPAADQLLRRIGDALQAYAEKESGWVTGRLNGSDFSLLATGSDDAQAVAEDVARLLCAVVDELHLDGERLLPVGGTVFEPGEALSVVLTRVDNALLAAEQTGSSAIQISRPETRELGISGHASWRSALSFALQKNDLKLGQYPVIDSRGKLLHFESPVRVLINGAWRHAALVLPWAARLKLLPLFDSMVLQAALRSVKKNGFPLGVNISPEAFCDPGFRDEVQLFLKKSPKLAELLWLEVPEYVAYRQLHEFKSFCNALKPLGCRIGLEHVGHHFSRISEMHDLGLDYIKVDASLIREVHANPISQTILRGLCTIAHSIGMIVIAEGVQTEEELRCLPGLGLDGMTGPAVRLAD